MEYPKWKENGKSKLMILVGTRPEIIRLACVIKKCRKYFDAILVHTGQNYDYTLNGIFFRDLGLDAPEHAIGTNTVDAMRSGIIFGTAGMLDRIIQEIEQDTGTPCRVFATGGCSPFITPFIRHSITRDPALLMKGLYSIGLRNL